MHIRNNTLQYSIYIYIYIYMIYTISTYMQKIHKLFEVFCRRFIYPPIPFNNNAGSGRLGRWGPRSVQPSRGGRMSWFDGCFFEICGLTLKWWVKPQQTHGFFPTKNEESTWGVKWGGFYHHLRKHPYGLWEDWNATLKIERFFHHVLWWIDRTFRYQT